MLVPDEPLRVAYITAGAGGMFCGSCLHDNTLARAMADRGVDIQLIPLYTPIRTDEDDVSIDQVFFGGINVYLQQKIPLFRHMPSLLDRFLDQPWLLKLATSRVGDTNPRDLGALTLSMLKGKSGYQRKEVRRLCQWLASSGRPHIINLSNILVGGCVPALKEELGATIFVTLQGDDIFLDELIEPYKGQVFDEIRKLTKSVDGFIVNTQYYADLMAEYFDIPAEKFHIVPLGIDTSDFEQFAGADREKDRDGQAPTVGFLARLAPEKGLHVLAEAFIQLRQRAGMENAQLRIAGWLGGKSRQYADGEFEKLRAAGLGDAFHYAGEVDREGKMELLSEIDVLSVPSVYRDPKGLYVLEALAAGVPVVQPDHGAFPELLAKTGGGRLVEPDNPEAVADALYDLLSDSTERHNCGRRGREVVHQQCNTETMTDAMLAVFKKVARR